MILESLLELVETLKARIDEHGDQLRQSEALTRYALIDPLLRELGWDTEDPASVIPEYKSGSGSADYALLTGNHPAMMIEAKKLGTPLLDSVVSQGIQYCLMEGTKHFSVTDGQRWEVYETHKPVPIDQKRVIEFDLKGQLSTEVCLKVLALWRPSVRSGHVVSGHQAVVELTESSLVPAAERGDESVLSDYAAVPPESGLVPATVQIASPIPQASRELELQSLTQLDHRPSRKPAEILFPDGSRTPLKGWVDILTKTIRWLMDNKMLDLSHCPIKSRRTYASRYIVHTQPVHSDGTPFSRCTEINGLYIERRKPVTSTKIVIKHVGQDPAQFSVWVF